MNGPPGTNRSTRHTFGDYYSILLIVFVVSTATALAPFASRHTFLSVLETGEGDVTRQIGYLSMLALAIGPVLLRAPTRLARSVPLTLFLLLIWCAVTISWSPAPAIAWRRLALTAVIAVTALVVTDHIELRSGLRVIAVTFIGLVAASLVTGLVAPHLGIHQPGDAESTIIGNWRGLFYHKNTFGIVAAIAVIGTQYLAVSRALPRPYAAGTLLMCTAGLLLSGSKTSIILTIFASGFMYVYGKHGPRSAFRLLAFGAVIGVGLALIMALVPGSNNLESIVDRPSLFTGRGLVWDLTFQLFAEQPIGGVGYQSVFQVGAQSAMRQMHSSIFIQTLPHAHNAYLETAATTGIVGLALLVAAVVVSPTLRISKLPRGYDDEKAVMTSLLLFVIMHSFLESGLVDRDRPTWVLAVLLIGLLGRAARGPSSSLS